MPHTNFLEGVYMIANAKATKLVVDTKYGEGVRIDELSRTVG
jgi:hypothetical protein